jgi:hypothetical protein
MRILLYNPDNGVTRNFMPHLWMFLLQSLTPPGHEVLLIDGNAKPMDEAQIAQYVRDQKIDLVGIGAMTRMIAKAYRMADAIRATGVKVVMGGPHVTELADEALGRDGGPRHADAVALGEADETWPRIVADAERGELKEVYTPSDETARSANRLEAYPVIPVGLDRSAQFNRIPKAAFPLLKKVGEGWETFHIIPVESGTRLSLRLRVLHRDRILRRLHSLPHQRERRQRTAAPEGARPQGKRPDGGVLHRRQLRHQREAHQVAVARHYRGRGAGALGGADQRQPAARRGTGGPDRGFRRQVGLHRHGVDRPGQSERREQRLQQARRIRRSSRAAGEAQRLRHYVIYFRHGQRHAGSSRAHAFAGAHLAAGPADFWLAHSVARQRRCTSGWKSPVASLARSTGKNLFPSPWRTRR